MEKKCILLIFLMGTGLCSIFSAELKAKDVALEACRKSSATESISYINDKINVVTALSEKRALYVFEASLQEQLGKYSEAQANYAKAAGISAGNADGMPQKSNEQLVIDAVRCALCMGDYETADSYLASSVRNSKNSEIISYVKLYSQWSALCRCESAEDLKEPVEILKAYINVPSMQTLNPVVLLTLWYITGDRSYSEKLTQNYPKSTEAAVVTGDVQLLPVPFWYFVPKTGFAEAGTGLPSSKSQLPDDSNVESESAESHFTKWQLGLFKSESNAKALCDEVKSKGFDAYITSEVRSSGTTYYIVLVMEDSSGNTAEKLRTAGYECYPVD